MHFNNQIIFINEYPNFYGGTEYYIYEVANNLKERGIQTILFYDGSHLPDVKMSSAFDQLYPIIDLESQMKAFPGGVIYLNNYRSPSLVKQLIKLPNPKFRFIHDHYLTCPRSSKTNPLTNKTCTKKVGLACYTCPGVVSRHNGKFIFRSPAQTKKELKLHNQFNGVIVSSLYLHREMTRNGLRSKKVTINPIYQEKIEGEIKTSRPKKQENLIIFVGSLIKGKGVETLIRSLSEIKKKFHLVVIGDGSLKSSLEKLVQETVMPSKITFTGRLNKEEVREYYSKAHAVIVPSDLPETFSKAGADGLHYGTLPICADVGGISSWLSHNKNGVLVEPNSVDSLSTALNKLAEGKYQKIINHISSSPSNLPSVDEHVTRLVETIHLELNRKTPPPKYSYAETDDFVQMMNEVCTLFKETVFKYIDKKNIDTILLIGGYGRGEGGIIEANGLTRPHNNLDFQIILNSFKTSEAWEKRQLILEELEKNKPHSEITLDFSFNTKLKIKFGTPQLVYYDMKYGHRCVYGDDSWLLGIKRYQSQNINLHDIRELLINRGTLLILNKKLLQKDNISVKEKKIIIKHLVKGIIGYGDALLYAHGKYHWSYKRKKELMWSIAPAYKTFARVYNYAVNFRFNPHYDRILKADLHLLQDFVLKHLEDIHLHFESSLDKKINNNWINYYKIFTSIPLHSQKKTIINLMKIFFKILTKKDEIMCAELKAKKATKCRVIGDQGILTAIFPFVLYESPLPNQLKDFHHQKLINLYIEVWGKNNDENFEQSLPGRIIAQEKEAA